MAPHANIGQETSSSPKVEVTTGNGSPNALKTEVLGGVVTRPAQNSSDKALPESKIWKYFGEDLPSHTFLILVNCLKDDARLIFFDAKNSPEAQTVVTPFGDLHLATWREMTEAEPRLIFETVRDKNGNPVNMDATHRPKAHVRVTSKQSEIDALNDYFDEAAAPYFRAKTRRRIRGDNKLNKEKDHKTGYERWWKTKKKFKGFLSGKDRMGVGWSEWKEAIMKTAGLFSFILFLITYKDLCALQSSISNNTLTPQPISQPPSSSNCEVSGHAPDEEKDVQVDFKSDRVRAKIYAGVYELFSSKRAPKVRDYHGDPCVFIWMSPYENHEEFNYECNNGRTLKIETIHPKQ